MGELALVSVCRVFFFPLSSLGVALGKTEPGGEPGQGLEGSVQQYYYN